MSLGGQDNRMNNITVDGSYFNNSFGLGAAPGDRTSVAPISMEAIEQVQVSVAPYDVRQGNFVGAGVNTVTRSGTNRSRLGLLPVPRQRPGRHGGQGLDRSTRAPSTSRTAAAGSRRPDRARTGCSSSAACEDEKFTQPGTTFRANKGGETVGGSVTRVLASDLNTLSAFLKQQLPATRPGAYQDYEFATPGRRATW